MKTKTIFRLNNKEEIDAFCFKHKEDGVVFGKKNFPDNAFDENGNEFAKKVNFAVQNMITKETLYFDWKEITNDAQ